MKISLARRLLLCLLFAAGTADAQLWMPSVFGDHMVLQRDRPIQVWGTASPGTVVSAQLGTTSAQATTDAAGDWRLTLPPRSAGGPPLQLRVDGDGQLLFEDVLMGEVWLASGQSNMQWSVSASDDAEAEIAAADHPGLRLFLVPLTASAQPQLDVDATWQICTPATVPPFSAVAYYFARRLHVELKVPVGIIASSWGGTRIEPWTTPEAIGRLLPDLPEDMRQSLQASMDNALQRAAEIEAKRAEQQRSIDVLQRAEADSIRPPFSQPDYDDGDWPTMPIPGTWEEGGLPGFDGLVWFRRTVDIPDNWAGRDLELHLCPADEADITWFDGTRVGASGSFTDNVSDLWDDPRLYHIDGRLVQPGRRTLSVRVIDRAFAGGLWGGEPDSMYLSPVDGDERLPLAGEWSYKPGPQLAHGPPALHGVPSGLYNAMIHPLVPFTLRGAIWYQGESNRGDGAVYTDKMAALIEGWRQAWDQPMAFYFAQLAPFRYGTDPELLPLLWEAQADVPLQIRDTGMSVITDVGDLDDIHPTDKQTVGSRLAGQALGRTYGKTLSYSGPRYIGMEREGVAIRLRFEHGRGLRSADGQRLTWFEIAEADGDFVAAHATIVGSSILVTGPGIGSPERVRFGWHETAEPNLVNGAGLPASPFRTHR